MSEPVQYMIKWSIKPGQQEEFKKLGSAAIDSVRSGEQGTRGYRWYFDDAGENCYLSEAFDSSESLLTHLENVVPVLPKFFECSDITRFEVFGNLTPAAREAVAGLNAEVHTQWSGFVR